MRLLSRLARIAETMPEGEHVSSPVGWLREQLDRELGSSRREDCQKGPGGRPRGRRRTVFLPRR